MTFSGPIGGLIDFAIGGGWGSEAPKDGHSRVAVIRGTDIPKVAAGDYSTVPFRFESDKKIVNRVLSLGDVVLETAGGSSANGQYTGRTLLITQEILDFFGPTICASFCKKLVLKKDLVEPNYFYFYMQDLYNSGRVASYDSQSTGISNFQYEAFVNNETLELPPKEVQVPIGVALENLNRKINENSKISKTLEELAQTIFKSWFIDFDPVKAKIAGERPLGMNDETASLFPESMEESKIGPIPIGWTMGSLGDVLSTLESGKRPRGGAQKSGVPSIGAESIRRIGQFNFAASRYIPRDFFESMPSGKVLPYDVLIYKDGAGAGSYVSMFGEGFPFEEFAINEHVFLARSTSVPQSYLFHWLNQDTQKVLMIELAQKSAQPGLNQQDTRSIPILVPSEGVLHAFSQFAEPLIKSIMYYSLQNVTLESVRENLLPRLLSGELQIPKDLLVS
jgi:type I restriction enzyme S subunit